MISGLIDWMPAMNSTIPKPTTFQVMEMTTAQKARSALTNQTIGWAMTRRSVRSLLSRPTCSSNSQNHSRLELESADNDRKEGDRAREPLERRIVHRQERELEAEDHQNRGEHNRVFDGEQKGAPEAGIVPDPDVVTEADEAAAAEQRAVGH